MGAGTGTHGRWLCSNMRLRTVQARLLEHDHRVSLPVISRLLKKRDYRLHVNSKQNEGSTPADRDVQFQYIQAVQQDFRESGQPVVSVDTKKKELIGDFKNSGRAWRQGAERVNVHDFPSQSQGRAVPYGIYDLAHNQRTVSLSQS